MIRWFVATVCCVHTPCGEETAMDMTVTGIGSVVVEELRAAGYMESTIGQYEKTIKALTRFVEERGSTYTPSLGVAFASMTVSPRTGRFSAQRRFDYGRSKASSSISAGNSHSRSRCSSDRNGIAAAATRLYRGCMSMTCTEHPTYRLGS
jgi:hypothetical protein